MSQGTYWLVNSKAGNPTWVTLHVHISLHGKLQNSILSSFILHVSHFVLHGLNATICLEKHTDNGHHCESAVRQLGRPQLGAETPSIHKPTFLHQSVYGAVGQNTPPPPPYNYQPHPACVPHAQVHCKPGLGETLEDDLTLRRGGILKSKLQLLRLLGRIAGSQDLEAKVACGGWGARRLVLGNLAEGHVGKDPEIFRTAEFDGWLLSPSMPKLWNTN